MIFGHRELYETGISHDSLALIEDKGVRIPHCLRTPVLPRIEASMDSSMNFIDFTTARARRVDSGS